MSSMQMPWLLTMQMSWLLTMQMSWLQTQQMSWLQTIRRLLSQAKTTAPVRWGPDGGDPGGPRARI